ncbi:MAG: BtrH N-terminal domain-containing protein [Bacteroidetes bacterium]|nr:BtrH N-terminal domain-containing protein [Bacteroidota bacterium]
MEKEFKHIQTAHCENGVATSLLRYHGLDFMTEPLVFGMGSGLFYIHIPFLMVNGGPAVSYRSMPGWIFSRASKLLGIKVKRVKFSNEKAAQDFVEEKVRQGIPIGCQVGVFNLPYFPPEYRFHFNAHNLIIYGKENGRYLVSDPVMEGVTTLSPEELNKVRFAKGPLAPKGHVYYPELVPQVSQEQIRKAIVKGIRKNSRDMLYIPGPIAGVDGIKYTANHIRKWREKLGVRKAGLYLGQIVRMQEEIGTGGGGFRFLYGAFLEQASAYLQNDELRNISDEFTKAGDMWRESAIHMGRIYKGRMSEQKDYEQSADMLMDIMAVEKEAFKKLHKLNLKY